jgi:phosphotransferase system enzyme I (PtsI)
LKKELNKEIVLKGIGVSPGIAIGTVYLVDRRRIEAPAYRYIESNRIATEVKRFTNAMVKSKEQLNKVKEMISETKAGREHAYIIDAHIMILEDKALVDDTIDTIKREKVNAEWALKIVLKKFIEIFSTIDDEYLSERVTDVEHIGDRILRNLMKKHHESIDDIKGRVIVVAHDLSPADTAQMTQKKVMAFTTDIGGRTSHTAIMARSLEIPAIVGLEDVTQKVGESETIIVDGIKGEVIISPTGATLKDYESKQREYKRYEKEFQQLKELPAVTRDGKRIELLGNIEILEELSSLAEHGAEGVGLYRTEFLYINKKEPPTEEEHLQAYVKVIKATAPFPVTIRTLDIGGDKFLSPVHVTDEINPAMGLRAIRLCLQKIDLFKVQLRGILRARAYGKVKVMFPMISGVEELKRAKTVLEEVKEELSKEGKDFDRNIAVGIMIEVPSAAIIADKLAKEADFFSIGTNDLLQYSLAIDRVNKDVAYLYEPLHPAILRLIKNVVDAAHREGIKVGICGEMAGEPEYALVLLGLGLDLLSMDALSIPKVKKLLRSIDFTESEKIVEKALNFSTVSEVKEYIEKVMDDVFKGELSGLAVLH